MRVPETPRPELNVEVASDGQHGDFLLRIFIDNKPVKEAVISTQGQFATEKVSIDAPPNTAVRVRLEFHANDWAVNAGYLREVRIE